MLATAEQPARLLTVAQAAVALQISENTVYRLLRARRLPGRQVGRAWRVLPDVLTAQGVREPASLALATE